MNTPVDLYWFFWIENFIFFKIIFYVMMMIYMEQLKVVVLLLFIILYLMIGRKWMVEHWIYLILMVNRIDWIFCYDLKFLDENQPERIAKSLLPKRNRLIFFEVTDKSYHQVIFQANIHCINYSARLIMVICLTFLM